MPLVYEEVDLSGASYLGDSGVQNKVVYQTGYTGIWFKKVSGTWVAYTTQPQGTTAAKNFLALVPSPDPNTVYNPTFGDNTILYSGTSNPVEIYYDTSDSKFKCGLPA